MGGERPAVPTAIDEGVDRLAVGGHRGLAHDAFAIGGLGRLRHHPGAAGHRSGDSVVDVVDLPRQIPYAVAVTLDVGRDRRAGAEAGRHHEPDRALVKHVRRPVHGAGLGAGIGTDGEAEGGTEELGRGGGIATHSST